MTRRGGSKASAHSHRAVHSGVTSSGSFVSNAVQKNKELLLRKHRYLRRATDLLIAQKYRSLRERYIQERMGYGLKKHHNNNSHTSSSGVGARNGSCTNGANAAANLNCRVSVEELINFWRDLPPVAKRALLRIHREVYLTALDQFLVNQNLCCECHDNVIAEWEDLEHQRSSSRSLQDVVSIFPPFLNDEDDDEDDEDDDEEDEEDDEDHDDDELDDEEDDVLMEPHVRRTKSTLRQQLEDEEFVIEEEEVVFRYNYHPEKQQVKASITSRPASASQSQPQIKRSLQFPAQPTSSQPLADGACCRHGVAFSSSSSSSSSSSCSSSSLAFLDQVAGDQDEFLRLFEKEERYVLIREHHAEFIIDLIRCGQHFAQTNWMKEKDECLAARTSTPTKLKMNMRVPTPEEMEYELEDDDLNEDRLLDEEEDDEEEDDEDDDECPGANTSHLAQEYLLEVLAMKFREQLEKAYQAALLHSLAVQAELLKDEQKASNQATNNKPSSKKKKKSKSKNQRKSKKTSAAPSSGSASATVTATATATATASSSSTTTSKTWSSSSSASSSSSTSSLSPEKAGASANSGAPNTSKVTPKESKGRSVETKGTENPDKETKLDEEVESFRLLLEQIHSESKPQERKKLVLPPGAFLQAQK